MAHVMNVAIIGAGRIGMKRAAAIEKIAGVRVGSVCDVNESRAKELARAYGAKVYTDWKKAASDSSVETVIVATHNALLPKVALEALKARKHVLIEKPGGTSSEELKRLLNASKQYRRVVWVGYNHRFHPAVAKAHAILKQ